jgi:hypothetical protein
MSSSFTSKKIVKIWRLEEGTSGEYELLSDFPVLLNKGGAFRWLEEAFGYDQLPFPSENQIKTTKPSEFSNLSLFLPSNAIRIIQSH